MKRIAMLLMSVGLLAPMVFVSVAAAEDANTTTTSSSQTTTSNDANDTSDDAPKPDDKALLKRLVERKNERKTKLTTNEQKHLMSVCKNAQGKATSTQAKAKGLANSRSEVYKNLVNRLNSLVTKLEAKNVDVTQLKIEITALQTKIDTFNTDLAAYKQAVTDLVSMDCASDPTAFKASLDAARAARDKALVDSAAVKDYVNKTIKPTLQSTRDQLTKTDDSTDSTEKTNTTGGTQ